MSQCLFILEYIQYIPIRYCDPNSKLAVLVFPFTITKHISMTNDHFLLITVYNEYEDQHNIPLIITTLSFIGVATIFTVVSTIFALMNTITVPIQTIHGSLGLYIWNGIAG